MMSLVVVAAGILALPAILFLGLIAPIVALLALPPLTLLVFRKNKFANGENKKPQQQHAIITGGSSGIGLSIALECVRRGVERVTILARNQQKLVEAKAFLEKEHQTTTRVTVVSVDVCDPAALQVVARQVCRKDDNKTVTTFLFANAGMAYPLEFQKLQPENFAQLDNVNYRGVVYTVHAFLPYLQEGTIVLTSSLLGQVGLYGFTSYAPTKFALRGFAEALHMELSCRQNLHVQVAYPPDTNTPGYKSEQEVKPKATHLMSETAGLFEPDVVGRRMVEEAMKKNPNFNVYFGLEGWMLSTLTAGMSPESSLIDTICQVTLMGLFRLVSLFYLNDFWGIVRTCDAEERQSQQVSDASNNVYGSMGNE